MGDSENLQIFFQKIAGARGLAPVKMGRKASLEKDEQTVETNHPVDGLPERICGPPGGVETELEFPKKLPVHCAETVNGGETESSVILLFQMKK